MHHLLFEGQARSRGVNQWFTASDVYRRAARAAPSLEKLSKEGVPDVQMDDLFGSFFSGVTSLLYNCPIDMRIERAIRAEYSTLKQAQFCGVAQMAHETQQASFSEKKCRLDNKLSRFGSLNDPQ